MSSVPGPRPHQAERGPEKGDGASAEPPQHRPREGLLLLFFVKISSRYGDRFKTPLGICLCQFTKSREGVVSHHFSLRRPGQLPHEVSAGRIHQESQALCGLQGL